VWVCACVRVCARARACVRACVCVCVTTLLPRVIIFTIQDKVACFKFSGYGLSEVFALAAPMSFSSVFA
jgi:hypothetical protein